MSFINTRPYFRDLLNGLGYSEHRDALTFENIPGTIIEKSYHIESGSLSTSSINQANYVFGYAVTIRVFKKAYNDPVSNLELLEMDIQNIYDAVLATANRLETTVLDVLLGGHSIESIDISNDNLLMGVISFNVLTNNCF